MTVTVLIVFLHIPSTVLLLYNGAVNYIQNDTVTKYGQNKC